MTSYLVATTELEGLIREMFLEQFGSCFSSTVSNVVTTLVNTYNRTGSVELIDAVIESMREPLVDYSPVDIIVEQFLRLVEAGIDTKMHIAELEFYMVEETIVVTPRERPAPNPSLRIKDEYHHAQAQGDFYPERLRRAFEELISSGI